MKKLPVAALAALALVATLPLPVQADDPVTPVEGAVCNLYLIPWEHNQKAFNEIASSMSSKPAAATFVDAASEFSPSEKKEGIASNFGMWTGWFKQEKAGTYTFTCKQIDSYSNRLYSIWVNGQQYAKAWAGQGSFDVELNAGFNSVKIIAVAGSDEKRPLTISYKKKGSVKDPVSFGPENMYHDDEED